MARWHIVEITAHDCDDVDIRGPWRNPDHAQKFADAFNAAVAEAFDYDDDDRPKAMVSVIARPDLRDAMDVWGVVRVIPKAAEQ